MWRARLRKADRRKTVNAGCFLRTICSGLRYVRDTAGSSALVRVPGQRTGAFTGSGSSGIGSDVTIPCRALASLKSWFRFRRMPGPKEML